MTTQPSLQVLGLVHKRQRILLARQAQQNKVTQAPLVLNRW